jgi:DNA repair exonuclease SbcCD nuclease subunit
MFSFIHSSDLHLGKRFGNFSGDLPGRLREARHAAIAKLAHHARDHGAMTILLAGDTFDTETPDPGVRRQALAEMGHHAPIRWVLLPGNHDSLQASQLWTTLKAEEPKPIALAADVVLLPSPCTARRPGRDLTEWMDSGVTPEGTIRIGLAHGAIQSFSEEGNGLDVIQPDRARRAGLEYLALGDWHGAVAVNPRTHYSGSPEPDRFKHNRPGEALLVTIAGSSAQPDVKPLETTSFVWRTLPLHVLVGEDPLSALATLLPDVRDRRQTLARVEATGRCRLSVRAALGSAINTTAPDFAYLELYDSALGIECEMDDLDQIDRAGALREAANALLAGAEDESRSIESRDIARAALSRLFSYALAVAP